MYKFILTSAAVFGLTVFNSRAELAVYQAVTVTSPHSSQDNGYPPFMKTYRAYWVVDLGDPQGHSTRITYWTWENVGQGTGLGGVKAFSNSGIQPSLFFNEASRADKKTYTNLANVYTDLITRYSIHLRGAAKSTVIKTGVTKSIARTLSGQSVTATRSVASQFDTPGASQTLAQSHVLKLDSALTLSYNNQGLTLEQASNAVMAQLQANGYNPD